MSSKPHVLFVSYTSDWTGPTHSLLLLLRGLRCDYEVTVLLPAQGLFSEALAREDIRSISLPSLSRASIPAMIRLIRQHKVALVYANNSSSSSRNAMIAARFAGVPFACHVREMGHGKSWRQMGYLRFAHAVIAVSQACAASLSGFVRPEKLHVVHNGIPLSVEQTERAKQTERQRARADLLAATHLSEHHVVVASLGHLGARKGQEHAIAAMAAIVHEIPAAHLVLIGSLDRDPAYVDRLRQMVQTLELGAHVSLMGFRPDVPQLLSGADLLLHTATTDPHPRAVLEAMVAGLPVVAFAVDGVVETVADHVTGFLAPLGDRAALTQCLKRLLAFPELRARMSVAGRQRVENCFSSRATEENVTQIINQLLQTHDRTSTP